VFFLFATDLAVVLKILELLRIVAKILMSLKVLFLEHTEIRMLSVLYDES